MKLRCFKSIIYISLLNKFNTSLLYIDNVVFKQKKMSSLN